MKIPILVDLSDMFDDGEEESLSEKIIQNITYQVSREVMQKVGAKSLSALQERIATSTQKEFDKQVNTVVSKIFKQNKTKKSFFDEKPISLEAYITEAIEKKYFNPDGSINDMFEKKVKASLENFEKQLDQNATQLVAQITSRYDAGFATLIVNKLQANNMLSDNVANILFPKEIQQG